ncbi:MAG: dephospho-CoA kinase [Simkaniaceae bacterium]|nr:dephospho-CoA kinase [Simkaniaceae bacterium]
MLRLKKVAVTGGIASGKSQICRFLREEGIYFLDADKIVHELLTPSTPQGKEVLNQFGVLDRQKLAQIVFNDPDKLKKLESILHPAVIDKIKSAFKEAAGSLFVVEFPLLFEIGFDDWFDTTIAVIADDEMRFKRAIERGMSGDDFKKRTSRLLPQEVLAEKADVTLVNNSSIDELKSQLNKKRKYIFNE